MLFFFSYLRYPPTLPMPAIPGLYKLTVHTVHSYLRAGIVHMMPIFFHTKAYITQWIFVLSYYIYPRTRVLNLESLPVFLWCLLIGNH